MYVYPLSRLFPFHHHGRTKNGYREVSIPLIVSRTTLTGTGQLPKFEDDLFAVNHKVGT